MADMNGQVALVTGRIRYRLAILNGVDRGFLCERPGRRCQPRVAVVAACVGRAAGAGVEVERDAEVGDAGPEGAGSLVTRSPLPLQVLGQLAAQAREEAPRCGRSRPARCHRRAGRRRRWRQSGWRCRPPGSSSSRCRKAAVRTRTRRSGRAPGGERVPGHVEPQFADLLLDGRVTSPPGRRGRNSSIRSASSGRDRPRG